MDEWTDGLIDWLTDWLLQTCVSSGRPVRPNPRRCRSSCDRASTIAWTSCRLRGWSTFQRHCAPDAVDPSTACWTPTDSTGTSQVVAVPSSVSIRRPRHFRLCLRACAEDFWRRARQLQQLPNENIRTEHCVLLLNQTRYTIHYSEHEDNR